MTLSPDRAVSEALVAPIASGLLMVGASGAVCVDGVCAVDSVAEPGQKSSRDAN